jgi:hypothetical protein
MLLRMRWWQPDRDAASAGDGGHDATETSSVLPRVRSGVPRDERRVASVRCGVGELCCIKAAALHAVSYVLNLHEQWLDARAVARHCRSVAALFIHMLGEGQSAAAPDLPLSPDASAKEADPDGPQKIAVGTACTLDALVSALQREAARLDGGGVSVASIASQTSFTTPDSDKVRDIFLRVATV